MQRFTLSTGAATALAGLALVAGTQGAPAAATRSVRISGGHATDARDDGRPVVLIAAALGVPAEGRRSRP
jgi:hypothetical protein